MLIKTKIKYNRMSSVYDLIELPVETSLFSKLRKKALKEVSGRVLEIGIGTGKNLEYYPPEVELTGIDFSSGMLKKAEKRKNRLNIKNAELVEMDAQSMDFENSSFDMVVSTFVFCTVPDPVKGLKEAYRVLKPGGRAVFIEHMKTDSLMINLFLRFMNIFSRIMLGTSMIRKTEENIQTAGFKIAESKRHLSGVVRVIRAVK